MKSAWNLILQSKKKVVGTQGIKQGEVRSMGLLINYKADLNLHIQIRNAKLPCQTTKSHWIF
jgi:hypothetical protein